MCVNHYLLIVLDFVSFQIVRIDTKIDNNNTKYEDWQTKADELDKWLVTTTTELKTIEEPTLDPDEREKQKKYLDVSNV